jgi:hypothetical protein
MLRNKKRGHKTDTQVPRFRQFRCAGTTSDGIVVTSNEAMKVRLFCDGVVVIFKRHGHGSSKGSLAGIYHSAEELAALELAASQARAELQRS